MFSWMAGLALLLLSASWMESWVTPYGPLPPAPDYSDSSQWYIIDRQGEADLFYIISTETGDHLIDTDTCHFADTRDAFLRGRMQHEMVAVDSFYSGRLNYYSPFYRQASMQSWADEATALSRLPLPMGDVMRSWHYYLEHLNQGRPFIIAGFSQGAYAVTDILKDMPDSVYSRMIAAYAIGYKITQADLDACPKIRPAQGATDTGVTICFNSAASPDAVVPIVSEGNVVSINPVNWRTDSVGSRFVYYTRRGTDTLSCHLDPASRLIIVDGYPDRKPMPVIGVPGNYHHMELKFYYPYIRRNMADRAAAFMKRKR